MIEFPNLQNMAQVSRTNAGRQYPQGKKELSQPANIQAGSGDVVQISTDAAMKGKLSAFASTLAREMNTVSAERIARLKEQYAGDNCPVCAADIAGAIFAGIRAEGSVNE